MVNLSLDRTFDYLIPSHLADRVRIGTRVLVPFGKGQTIRPAYVVAVLDQSDYPELKEVLAIEGERPLIPQNLVRLAQWMAEYYCCAREKAVHAMLPAVVRSGRIRAKKVRVVRFGPAAEEDLPGLIERLEKKAPKQAAVLQALARRQGQARAPALLREAGASASVLRRLEELNLVEISHSEERRDPFADDVVIPTTPPAPTPEQQTVLEQILPAVEERRNEVFLLHGVTGSGKTEVYMRAIARCIELGREAIVLVPEISLTPQTCERFRARFGEQVAVLHSGLSDGERFDEWNRVHTGRARIVVGARSALFAPLRNLGLIVVDEEHENTYKQDETPRYHARDTAVMRGKIEGVPVILGSATPSLESVWNCRRGKYRLLRLTQRVDGRTMPTMELVDMRAEAAMRGRTQVFSRRLVDLIRQRLDRREQTILFLNRRGYATQMMCTKCGYVAMCPNCSVTYTYHRGDQKLLCHLCGSMREAPFVCPQCKDPEIRYTGLGTEKIEEIVGNLFPKANVARMDSDTMTRRHAHRRTLLAFRAGRIDILVGTQMIAKGLDFPKVTLVGIIFADLGLYLPDFRAGERTFQLLTQVAGRAGRGDIPGHVVVQSYTPFHPALQAALEGDCEGFWNDEIETRKAFDFPPATHMAIVHFRSPDAAVAETAARMFADALRPLLPPNTIMADPIPAPIARARKFYRFQLVLRTRRIVHLARVLRRLVIEEPVVKRSDDLDVYVDVDPYSVL